VPTFVRGADEPAHASGGVELWAPAAAWTGHRKWVELFLCLGVHLGVLDQVFTRIHPPATCCLDRSMNQSDGLSPTVPTFVRPMCAVRSGVAEMSTFKKQVFSMK